MKDSDRSHIHLTVARSAAFFDDWMRVKLDFDDVVVPAEHQPINPDDDDGMIPDQHATFGITKTQEKLKEPAWKDLALTELMENAPSTDVLDQLSHVKSPRFNKVNEQPDSAYITSPDHATLSTTSSKSKAKSNLASSRFRS